MKRKVAPSSDVPLEEVEEADVERMDGVKGPANKHPFLLMRAQGGQDAVEAFYRAEMSSKSINDLPDSAFAYIEPGGAKDEEGKTTPRDSRHYPIHDEAHVANARARIAQQLKAGGAGGEIANKAKGKVNAAAKKMGIGDEHVERQEAPGSPDWEALDAQRLRDATAGILQVKASLESVRDREQVEALAGDPDDYEDVSVLCDALEALCYVLEKVATLAVTEQAEATQVNRAVSNQNAQKIRDSVSALSSLLTDTGSTAEIPPEGEVDQDMTTQNKAGDRLAGAGAIGTSGAKVAPPAQPVIRKSPKIVKREGSTHGAFDGDHSHDHADGDGGMHSHEHSHDGEGDHGHSHEVEREQAPRIGSANTPSMGGSGSGGAVSTPNYDQSTSDAQVGTAGAIADVAAPQQTVADGEAGMKAAVASTAAVVALATHEEESPDVGQQIARSLGPILTGAFEKALAPMKETLERIAKEDSRSQPRPLVRGADPMNDYHLVRRDGQAAVTSGSEELQRALDSITDPVLKDQLTREIAKNQHPLLRNQEQGK